MNDFHEYLAGQLQDRLRRRRVVLFYDPREEFTPFIDELTEGTGDPAPMPVTVGSTKATLARFDGSWWALKVAVEPWLKETLPDPLLIYAPSVERRPQEALLMEAEAAGERYEPQLRRLARHALTRDLSDAQVDELLKGDVLTWQDVVSFLGTETVQPSRLHSVYGSRDSEGILTEWLASPDRDDALLGRGAVDELRELVRVRLGFGAGDEAAPQRLRDRTARYLLLGEFRLDLSGAEPEALSATPAPQTADQKRRVRDVVQSLRVRHPEAYLELAPAIEKEFRLDKADIPAENLGSVDTFPFEEEVLLGRVCELLAAESYKEAWTIVEARRGSFWLQYHMRRQAQWEVCRRIVELGQAVSEAQASAERLKGGVDRWVAWYTGPEGAARVDRLHRHLESTVAGLQDEPQAEAGLNRVRRRYEALLQLLAERFVDTLAGGGWALDGVLPQTRTFDEVVEDSREPTAYLLVDAFRYEMAGELQELLRDAEGLELRPAVAAIPSITVAGMAALLPSAAGTFRVVANGEGKGRKVAAAIGDEVLTGWSDRWRYLERVRPGVKEFRLGPLLSTPAGQVAETVDGARLVVVRSQEIDQLGEGQGGLLAQQAIGTVVGNLARAVRKLAGAGIRRFVVAADHGFVFASPKDDDMKIPAPSGETVELHRRVWVGRGGDTPSGCVRITSAELGYASDLDFVVPRGVGVFQAGGGLAYHHGGVSLQELVVPVLTVRMPGESAGEAGSVVELGNVPRAITNRIERVELTQVEDLLSEPLGVRVTLVEGDEEVGHCAMAVNAEYDGERKEVTLQPGTTASLGLILVRDDAKTVRIVVQDARTDAVLTRSRELPVKLGI